MHEPKPTDMRNRSSALTTVSAQSNRLLRRSSLARRGALPGLSRSLVRHLYLFFVGLAALLCASCQTTVSTTLPEANYIRGPVTLGPGDVVKLTFPGAPEMNQTQQIQADGKINLPMVGEVAAGGRTVADLQRTLEALYKSQLQNTTVVVTLESSVTRVTIGGSVNKPGKYVFDRPTTVLEAIMEAGGPDRFGTLSRVSIVRLVNGQQRTQVLDLRPVMQGVPTKPTYVQSGDVVLVAESKF